MMMMIMMMTTLTEEYESRDASYLVHTHDVQVASSRKARSGIVDARRNRVRAA